jgi:hypothetical protein
MIGVNTSIFKSAGRKLVNLLGALKDRATYYENGTDSVAEKNRIDDLEKNRIDDLGVLDKATILLTPTATSNARVHSVKTYTGENFLTGNNSTFDSGIGDWQVYNGASGASVAHSTDKLEVTLSSGEGGARINTSSLFTGGQAGKTLKIRARIWKGTSTHSTIAIYIGGVQKFVTISSTPTYFEALLKPTNTGYLTIYRAGTGSTGTYFIDDVSDFDFDRASSATRINSSGLVQDMQSITDPELVLNGDFEELGDEDANYADGNVSFTDSNGSISTSLGTNNYRSQGNGTTNDARPRVALSNSGLSNGKTYKLIYTPTSVTGSSVFDFFENGIRLVNNHDISQPLTFYFTSVSSQLQGFDFDGSQTFSVDYTLSVKQVDPNNRWTLSGATTFEDGVLHFESNTNEYSYARQLCKTRY